MAMYLGSNEVAVTKISDNTYGWLGGNVQYLGKIYEWNGTLNDTRYSSWTPSTSTSTILSSQSSVAQFTIPDRTQETYYVITRWGMDFAYNSGTTMTYAPINYAFAGVSSYYNYPSSHVEVISGDYSGFSSYPIASQSYLWYYNSSGTLTGGAVNYGPAYSNAQTSWAISVSGNSVTVVLNRPLISARCSTTYFTTARAANIDTANSTIKCRLDLFKGSRDDLATHRYRLITDIYNDNWDFS